MTHDPRHISDTRDLAGATAQRRIVTWRSLLAGSAAIAVTGLLTNYNDHVAVNTFMIGSYLPLALVLTLFLMVIVINGLLRRFFPTRAMTAGELAIVLLMAALGCSIPAQGLFRYFTPMLIAPFREGVANPTFWSIFTGMDLPAWLFPVPIAEGRNHPVINTFYGRVQPGEPIPWGAWIAPLLGWGVFIIAWLLSIIAMVWIFRRQWSVSERLPFPIASIEASLIAEPPAGRAFNELLASRLFWIALVGVVIWQSFLGLNKYFPRYVPLIPLSYNFFDIMADKPWIYFNPYIKSATVYFTFIGIAYFIQGRISFSLWATFLIADLVNVQHRIYQNDLNGDAWRDQHLGASLAFVAGFLWIARQHIAAVCRQMIFRPGGTVLTREENYRWPAYLLLTGTVVMGAWLLFVGVQFWFTILLLALILMAHLVTARVVAETGLPFVRADFTMVQVYSNMNPRWLGPRDLFFAAHAYVFGPVATRESAAVFAQQALVTADQSGVDTARLRRQLAGVIVWSLLLALVASAIGSLWTHYVYATPIALQSQHPVLDPPAMDRARSEMVDPMVRHADGSFAPKAHSPLTQFSIGVAVTGILQWLSLRSAAWPFLPVGYLLCTRWYIGQAWFSLMIGWLAKQVIVRYGGATMYQKARPLFVGLIFGEALAAGIWLVISLLIVWSGNLHQAVPMLPQ